MMCHKCGQPQFFGSAGYAGRQCLCVGLAAHTPAGPMTICGGGQAALDDARAPFLELAALRKDAERYRWLRDNPLWSVSYRIKLRSKTKEWRMRDEGEYWGQWWPTHEQAVDHAMQARTAVGVRPNV